MRGTAPETDAKTAHCDTRFVWLRTMIIRHRSASSSKPD